MLITNQYRKLNKDLHATNKEYGVGGKRWAQVTIDICNSLDTRNVLDYGCGKGVLRKSVPLLNITEYDPAVEGKDGEPEKTDIVVCFDVLEHVEPKCLDAVLRHIKSLTVRGFIASVATKPAQKFLADGRNAHLIQKDLYWWLNKINRVTGFQMQQLNNFGDDQFIAIYKSRAKAVIKEEIEV